MRKYSVPADFDTKTIDAYHDLNTKFENSKVIQTYGQLTGENSYGSGRVESDLPSVALEDLKRYIDYSHSKNICFNYTFNATSLNNLEFSQEGIDKLVRYFTRLKSAGVDSVTVALPPVMEILKKLGIEVHVSTVCDITNLNEAMEFKYFNADKVIVAETINRQFKILSSIVKNFGPSVEIIINPFCRKDCSHRSFHYQHTNTFKKEGEYNYYHLRCLQHAFDHFDHIMEMCWVRPEDIRYYEKIGLNYFKIQGRHFLKTGDIVRVVRHYFEEKFDGNLIDLLYLFTEDRPVKFQIDNTRLDGFLDPFFKVEGFCESNCMECKYCGSYLQNKSKIDRGEFDFNAKLFKKVFKHTDRFSKELRKSVSTDGSDTNHKIDG